MQYYGKWLSVTQSRSQMAWKLRFTARLLDGYFRVNLMVLQNMIWHGRFFRSNINVTSFLGTKPLVTFQPF